MVTADRVRQALSYNVLTGEMNWVERRRGVTFGAVAGRISNASGYRDIGLDGRLYRAHRLIWLWVTGRWPESDIDHINRDRADNRWSNLRLATPSQNAANIGLRTDNTTGNSGVVWDSQRNKWRAQIRINGRKTNLGRFVDRADAEAAIKAAAVAQWGEYAGY